MIRYEVQGPNADGEYLVGHIVPGCPTFHVDCPCRTKECAEREAARLNEIAGVAPRLEADLMPEEREA